MRSRTVWFGASSSESKPRLAACRLRDLSSESNVKRSKSVLGVREFIRGGKRAVRAAKDEYLAPVETGSVAVRTASDGFLLPAIKSDEVRTASEGRRDTGPRGCALGMASL